MMPSMYACDWLNARGLHINSDETRRNVQARGVNTHTSYIPRQFHDMRVAVIGSGATGLAATWVRALFNSLDMELYR